jgi:hypothetical protein
MSDTDDDRLWSEIGAALAPRKSEAQWTSLRLRVMARVNGASAAVLRPWVAASALAALGFGLLLISRLTVEPAPVETVVASWDARLTSVDGLVTVLPSGRTEAVAAAAGLPVSEGDVIQVGADGRAELALSDKGLVSLGPGSTLALARLDQAQSFLDLSVGSLVAKLNFHADVVPHRLAVRTPAAVAAVRGTEFGVVVDADGGTSVGVFDQGRVSVTDKADASIQETMLTPNQEARVPSGAAPDVEVRDGRAYLQRSGELKDLSSYRPVLDSVRGREDAVRRDWRAPSREERARERARLLADAPRVAPPAPVERAAPPARSPESGPRAPAPAAPASRGEPRERGGDRRSPAGGGPRFPAVPPPGGGERRPGAREPSPAPGAARPRPAPNDGRRGGGGAPRPRRPRPGGGARGPVRPQR